MTGLRAKYHATERSNRWSETVQSRQRD